MSSIGIFVNPIWPPRLYEIIKHGHNFFCVCVKAILSLISGIFVISFKNGGLLVGWLGSINCTIKTICRIL